MIKYLKKLSVLSIIVLTCILFGCFEPDPNDISNEYYDGYVELNVRHPSILRSLYKANVCYYYNLQESDYYYVDYYDADSLIEFIPPDPFNEGYIFGGWYKEKECINKWDFEKDTVSLEEDEIEIKLYAKWIKE